MVDENSSGRVQRDIGMLRGEMSGVQKDIARVEGKVDEGFESLRQEIQSLRETRSFAQGISYVVTGLIAALVSAAMAFVIEKLR